MLVRESILNETYESYSELKKLSQHIDHLFKSEKIKEEKIYFIKELVNTNEYKILKNFIDNNLGLLFLDVDDNFSGIFLLPENYKYHTEDLDTSLEELNKFSIGIVLINVDHSLDMNNHPPYDPETILHELQHSFDYYRSKGKTFSSEKNFNPSISHENEPTEENKLFIKEILGYMGKLDEFKTFDEFKTYISDEFKRYEKYCEFKKPVEEIKKQLEETALTLWKMNKDDKRFLEDYFNRSSEKSAYFVQALYNFDFMKDENQIKTLKTAWDEFIKIFGINVILGNARSDKTRKKIAQKFSQYYYKFKEEHNL